MRGVHPVRSPLGYRPVVQGHDHRQLGSAQGRAQRLQASKGVGSLWSSLKFSYLIDFKVYVLQKQIQQCKYTVCVSESDDLKNVMNSKCFHLFSFNTYEHNVYRVSQEERTKLREGVPYVKLYRYNPKYLCPKLNGY